jgi:hypothetical protein
MNEKLEQALKFGHDHMTGLGLTPIVGWSCLLTLMAWNDLFDKDIEADFVINGDLVTPELEKKILTSPALRHWTMKNQYSGQRTIFYFTAPNGIRVSCSPYYIKGDFAWINLTDSYFFFWKQIHFDTLQTKTFKGTMYNIPYDPIGYLEEYYGKPWDDFEGRAGWNWKQGKNMKQLKEMPQ